MRSPVDCIYVAASTYDGRFTRICIASIRAYYETIPIKLLIGGPLEPGLAQELAEFWNVDVLELPAQDYGWGFVKLEPLFLEAEESFLVLDSDIVITGRIIDHWMESETPFLVDDEAQSEADTKRLYFDWECPEAQSVGKPNFVFNSGQWFGTSGHVNRQDFDDVVHWGIPPRLKHPDVFKNGDQGVLNYILNRKSREGVGVTRKVIMHWPGNGMSEISATNIRHGRIPAIAIHWAGMKESRLGAMVGSDVLRYFESIYYNRLPGGWFLRYWRAFCYLLKAYIEKIEAKFR